MTTLAPSKKKKTHWENRPWGQSDEEWYLLAGLPLALAALSTVHRKKLTVLPYDHFAYADCVRNYQSHINKRTWHHESIIDNDRLWYLSEWILNNLPFVERRDGIKTRVVTYPGAIPFWSTGNPQFTLLIEQHPSDGYIGIVRPVTN